MDSRINERIDPIKRLSSNVQEFEEVYALKTHTTADVLPADCHWKLNGNLTKYDHSKIKALGDQQNLAEDILLGAFKRILLFEVSAYIEETYAIKLPSETESLRMITEINRAKTSLMHDADYTIPFNTIARANESLIQKVEMSLAGNSGGKYLYTTNEVLDYCKPGNRLKHIDVAFAGKRIFFSICRAEFSKNLPRDEYSEIERTFPSLFCPTAGYILLQSPESIEYAKNFFNYQYEFGFQTVEPSKIEFGGRKAIDLFRLQSGKK